MLQIQEKILPILLAALTTGPLYGRSIYRPEDTTVPEIRTRWTDETRSYTLRHNSLEAGPIFSQFDPDYFDAHLFPDGPVTFRNRPDQSVPGSVLKNYLETLIQEIAVQKKRQQQYRHFTVIKQRDYNPRKHAGLMILKCKEYPFVIKLFMETPESFVEPFSKGLEPICFFMMGGGVNRYLAGFSRVKNALAIEKIIQNDPLLRGVLSVPRKWFWKPQQCRWFEVTGKNFGSGDYRTTLPATYAIICDAIDAEQSFHLTNKNHRNLGITFANRIGSRVDPNIKNYMFERSSDHTSNNEAHNIVLVDTEHFPTMVGLRDPITFSNYTEWYTELIKKCGKDSFFRLKSTRKAHHGADYTPIIRC